MLTSSLALHAQTIETIATNRLAQILVMDDSSYRLNFDPGKKDEIYHYSSKE
jgi:hypothetical protein